MVNQEQIYQLLYSQDWKQILAFLHENKSAIAGDPMLTHAADIFEAEFFRLLSSFSFEDTNIEECLDDLYVLNHMKFIKIKDSNYKALIIALIKRKPLKEAANYASIFPDEKECKEVIDKFNALKTTDSTDGTSDSTPFVHRWIEVYNRLFELFNNPQDAATYINGPRFIKVVQEFQNYFPDYNQFMDFRTSQGLSTTRKIYYFDILKSLDVTTRQKVIERLLNIIRPFNATATELVESLLYNTALREQNEELNLDSQGATAPRKVFVSYSWDSEEHKGWVLALARRLREQGGLDVILDQFHLRAGKSITHFVETSIRNADKIIIVFTPNYKLKADTRTKGVGYEYSIINVELYQNQTNNDKIIPVLRGGSMHDSIPTFMQQFIHLDISNDQNFENSYQDLLREIYDQPAVIIPPIGERPTFAVHNSNIPNVSSNSHANLASYLKALEEIVEILVPNQTSFDLDYIEAHVNDASNAYLKFQNSRVDIWMNWEAIILSNMSSEIKNAYYSRFIYSFNYTSNRFREFYNDKTLENARHNQVLYITTELKTIIFGVFNAVQNDSLELDRFIKLYNIETAINGL